MRLNVSVTKVPVHAVAGNDERRVPLVLPKAGHRKESWRVAVFAVLPLGVNPALESAIKNAFPNDCLRLANGDWLISYAGTAIKLSEELEVTDGKNGTAVILQISSYYGRAPTSIWDWIKTKFEARSNA